MEVKVGLKDEKLEEAAGGFAYLLVVKFVSSADPGFSFNYLLRYEIICALLSKFLCVSSNFCSKIFFFSSKAAN